MYKNLQHIEGVDVLTTGAGTSGCLSAIAASSSRKYRVLNVERYGFSGGTSTQCLTVFMVSLRLVTHLKNSFNH